MRVSSRLLFCTGWMVKFDGGRMEQKWRRNYLLLGSLFLLLLLALTVQANAGTDPYKILGVQKHATLQDIRKAYKQLAKEWHPDKSSHPEAEAKFVEIKQAYELLSDTERRTAYDSYGITNEDAHLYRERPDYSSYGRFPDPFEQFFGHNFNFHDQDISLFHRLSITTKYYETNIIPKSRHTPQLLMFYSDWCFFCMKAANSFKKTIDMLEPYGVNFATINAGHENLLIRKVGVHSVPCIIMVLDGHNYVYKDSIYNTQRIVDFIRQKLPYGLLPTVDDSSIDKFLQGWEDNRVRALVVEPKTQPRLRYLITAFHFRERVAFGFVQINSKKMTHIQERFKVHPSIDTLLIFNEDTSRPVASIAMSDIPTSTLNNIISVNKYLALPRLSSQSMLEGVCPAEWNRPRKRLCVVLITENTSTHDEARLAMRRMALESTYSPDRVRYAYIYREKQTEFISALTEHSNLEETVLKVVIIWRRDTKHIKYEWVHEATLETLDRSLENETHEMTYNTTKQKLDGAIQRLLRSSEALVYEAEVKDLLDEHAQGLIIRILKKILLVFDFLSDNVGQEHILPALSVVGTIAFILVAGYLMSYLVRVEEESIQRKKNAGADGKNGKVTNYVPELRLHELRAEKYNGLVRLLKPGCRTIVLLTDLQSRNKLIPAFHKAVWPYRKNKTLMFAHMLIEKGIGWYAELLRLSLSESREMKINPRNCIGTVIALNGHRKYFCMYHAKHPESNRGAKRMMKMTRQLSTMPSDPEAGAFLGMDTSDSETSISDISEPKILLEENLLDGLPNWLDRLFEGTTHRYYINYWPDFTSK
ncbi:dnaJ homolog subfamily C member 16 [Toxorhynchites rutilus septentrionalis]|uniref:dnaJ homolog subfamily C member 16 n=1 Tax=Toxorhynchites rutilus septentrionalis TaxID=329112 RepID=UPI0024784014|nr:dnaJ homolog subfamily C member 16 [Toxorhynchites rutilus septentrionalis]